VSQVQLRCQCTLGGATRKRLRLFSQDIGVDTLPFPYALTNFQENDHWENLSRHYGKEAVHHPVESNTVPKKANCLWPSQTCDTQKAPTDNSDRQNSSFFCFSWIFSGPVCTVAPTNRNVKFIYKGKAFPLQAWSGPEGSRKLRFPDFMTTAQDGGKVVSLMHRPPLTPGNTPGTHFC